MKSIISSFSIFTLLVLLGCNTPVSESTGIELTDRESATTGKLDFLLDYNGKKPEDAGLLTNPIVKQRLVNLMKDSFQVMAAKTNFSSAMVASKKTGFVAAKFFNNKEQTDLSAMVIIDTKHEIFWVYYYNGDKLVKFTDNPSSTPAGLN